VPEIPIIDLGMLRQGCSTADIATTARSIRSACEAAGFFSILNHGVPARVVEDAFEANRRFHALPQPEKDALRTNKWHRGYMGFGDATLKSSARFAAARRPNRMESFFVRHEVAPDHPDILEAKPLQGPNQWPADTWLCQAIRRYGTAICELGLRLLPALSVAVGEAPDYLGRLFDPPSTALRLIHYPPTPEDRPDDLYGSHPHTDYGFLTILAQDEIGGLEVQGREGAWLPVPVIQGAFVCNIGDVFARWTNDAFNSTPHRVINASTHRDRYSVAYFFDPNVDATVTCLPQFCRDAPAKHAPVRFIDYFTSRLDANYVRYEQPSAAA